MREKLVAFVVGHEKWGKSYTLRALHAICGEGANRVAIGRTEFFVRRSSNDDIKRKKPDSYTNFMHSVSSPYVIAALCPKFKKLRNYDHPKKVADGILRGLKRKGYRLVFWVIKYRWGKSDRYICREEISELRKYGRVRVFERIDARDRARAKSFRAFVLSTL